MANPAFQPARKAKQTWLVGKVKCGRCGYALASVNNTRAVRYMRCHKRADSKGYEGCGTMRTDDVERFVFESMKEKLRDFRAVAANGDVKNNPKLTAAKIELAQIDAEIERLVDSLTGANATLLAFANRRAEELDGKRKALLKQVNALTAAQFPTGRLNEITAYLDNWENTSLDDKRQAVDNVITVIRATSEKIEIEWKI